MSKTLSLHPELKVWLEMRAIDLTKKRKRYYTPGDVVAILAVKEDQKLNRILRELGIQE